MDNLINLHGRFFGTFWSCKTCAEIGWSPQFNSRNEMEIHINKIHMNAKANKINIDNKIAMIIEAIREYDEQFLSLIHSDVGECFEKIKFFIGCEENLDNLDESALKYLIKQIETFYLEKETYGSLVNYDYLIDYNADVIMGRKVAFITEAKPSVINKNSQNDLTKFLTNSSKVECKTGENSNRFCDITLACDDKQLKTPKVEDLFNNRSYDFTEDNYYRTNKHSEEILKTKEFYSDFINKLVTANKFKKDNIGDHDSTRKQIIVCDYCLYKTKENKYLEWHMESFHEENLFCGKCKISSQLKRGKIIHMENEQCDQEEIIKSGDQISINTHDKSRDIAENFIINKTNSYPNIGRNVSDLIKKDSIFVANIEYDDNVIKDLQAIENLHITNYDLFTNKTEGIGVSIKEELLNYDKNNKNNRFCSVRRRGTDVRPKINSFIKYKFYDFDDWMMGTIKKVGKSTGKGRNVCWIQNNEHEKPAPFDFGVVVEDWDYLNEVQFED